VNAGGMSRALARQRPRSRGRAGFPKASRILCLAAFWLAFLMAMAGCGRKEEPVAIENKGYICLGVVAPLSGMLRPAGLSLVRGAELAVRAAGGQGGVRGRPVRLLIEDETQTLRMPEKKRLARDPRVVLVIGHLMERTFADSRALYLKTDRPVLLPVLSPENISQAPKPLFFRLMSSDQDQVRALAAHAVSKLRVRRILAVHDGSAHGLEQVQTFVEAVGEGSAEVRSLAFAEAGEAFEEFKRQAQAYRPEAVFTTLGGWQVVALGRFLSGLKPAPALLGGHGLALAEVAGFLARLLPETFLALPYDPGAASPAGRKFAESYRQAHHRAVDWVAVAGYDAASLALAALAQAGDDPQAIAGYLASLNGPSRSFEGLAGGYYFEAGGRGVHPAFVIRLTESVIRHLP